MMMMMMMMMMPGRPVRQDSVGLEEPLKGLGGRCSSSYEDEDEDGLMIMFYVG